MLLAACCLKSSPQPAKPLKSVPEAFLISVNCVRIRPELATEQNRNNKGQCRPIREHETPMRPCMSNVFQPYVFPEETTRKIPSTCSDVCLAVDLNVRALGLRVLMGHIPKTRTDLKINLCYPAQTVSLPTSEMLHYPWCKIFEAMKLFYSP